MDLIHFFFKKKASWKNIIQYRQNDALGNYEWDKENPKDALNQAALSIDIMDWHGKYRCF